MLNPHKNQTLEILVDKYQKGKITKEEFKVYLTGKLFRNRSTCLKMYRPNRLVLRNIGMVEGDIKSLIQDEDYFEYLKFNDIELKYYNNITNFIFEDNGGR